MPTFTSPNKLSSAKWIRKFAGAVADDDAIKTSIATSASPATYITTALNGVMGQLSKAPCGRTLTVTTSTHTGTYNIVDPIVITGLDTSGNVVITESLYLTAVNGNETVAGTKSFSKVTSIAVPAQVDALGTFKFGVRNIVTPYARQVKVSTAGNLVVAFLIDDTVYTETYPASTDEKIDLNPLYIDYTSTAQDITFIG